MITTKLEMKKIFLFLKLEKVFIKKMEAMESIYQ